MTYNVFSGTLNPTQSINLWTVVVLHRRRSALTRVVLWCSWTFSSSSINWRNWQISGQFATPAHSDYNDDDDVIVVMKTIVS